MVFECRLRGITRKHAYGALVAISLTFLLDYLDIMKFEYWSSYAIGVVLALAFLYLVENSKVRVEVNDDIVTIYHSGMVQASIPMETIDQAVLSGEGRLARIIVSTTDGLRYYIPMNCFGEAEVTAVMNELKRA